MIFPSIIHALEHHAATRPEAVAFSIRTDDGVRLVTFVDLDRAASSVAADLQERDLAGQRALLFFPFGIEFVTALLACFKAGVVGIGAYPPRLGREDARADHVYEASRAATILSTREFREKLAARRPECIFWQTPWIDVDETAADNAEGFLGPSLVVGDDAFIQFTSGSTGDPKGVVLTHDNIAHNADLIATTCGMHPSSVIVSWLPLYHDMGLFGTVLLGIWSGCETVLLSPHSVIQKPYRWLEAISEHRATLSGGPNFAYDLCVDRVSEDQLARLDLGSWEIAFNGSEPIWAETLTRFSERFAACGFRHDAHYPCYGMAEATLFVTGGDRAAPPTWQVLPGDTSAGATRPRVGCGRSAIDALEVVDPETRRPVPDGEVGEIWISGRNVARGYWGATAEDAARFGARLEASDDRRSFFRTGDLGVVEDGELYVVGRLKDLIIVAGRNHYPQDIERLCQEAAPEFASMTTAAFSVDADRKERVIVLQEVARPRHLEDPEALARAARQRLARELELEVHGVVLLRPMTLPKTTSGKVRRRRCRELFLSGAFDPVWEWSPGSRGAVVTHEAI